MEKQCFIMYQIDTLPVRNCSQNEEIHFNKCNMTGMWDIFDPDIQYACESTYKLVYKVYKNIFCFICNPIRRIYTTDVRTCNSTGSWKPFDQGLHDACQYYNNPDNSLSFLNVFCYLCNRDNTFSNSFVDVNASITYGRKGSVTFYTLQNISDFSLSFYKQYLNDQMKITPVTANDKENQSFTLNLTNTLLKAYAYNPFLPGLCNEELLPLDALDVIKPIMTPCSCPGCLAPYDIPGVKIRNLFQIDQTKTSDEPWDVHYCSDGQLYDKIEKNCRNITCFPGRHLIGGSCDPLFTVTRNIRYNLEVFVRNADSPKQFNGTEKIILRWFENIVRNHSIGITSLVILKTETFSNFPCSLGQSNPNVFTYIAFDVFIESNIYRNDLEQSLLKIAPENSDFEKDNDTFSMEISLASAFSDLLTFVHMAREFRYESKCWKLEENTELLNKYGNYKSTKINRQIVCPQFVFDADQYTIDGYSVLLIKYKIIIHYDIFLIDSNNKIRICVDDFLSFLLNRYIKSSTEYALEITTIVCTCVSLFCLLVTFITYCIFPILRTLPGKNNMCLILSLLIAQTCLQFGTIWTDRILICKAIGIILHVFWLSTFACMNVCSYHMYSVFTTFRPTSSMSENNGLFLRYVCYSYGTPFIIVIINISTQIMLSGGANIGYGGSNCFISDIPQIAAFICPVGLICVINIWLFGFTAYTIYTRPIIRSTANDKQDFYVYIKLFSLTGITWIGQIVDSFIPLSVFSFVVTILTGLQGLFIFLSFVCNKRVYNLFLGMCKYNHSESVRESIRLYSLYEVNGHEKCIKRYPITKTSKIS
ncbi:uncharacterized protein [Mytilus edulis]|uniref:uncharacterized protein n=1 Tax=Mytilus edulis TaxID=6550 RepID=UPI0039EFAC86